MGLWVFDVPPSFSNSFRIDLKEIILKKEKDSPTTIKSNQGGWQSEGDFFRWGGESIEKLHSIFKKAKL